MSSSPKAQTIGGSGLHSVTIPAGSDLVLGGWAVDSPAVEAASGVAVDIDSKVHVVGQYGLPRADVARALSVDDYTASGFRVEIPARDLLKGAHTVALDVYANDRSGHYRAPHLLKVLVR